MSTFSNFTAQALAHQSYLSGSDTGRCSYVFELPLKIRCAYITETLDCNDTVAYIDYVNYLFCVTKDARMLGIFSLIVLSLLLIALIFIHAEFIYVPTLIALSNAMELNDNLSGLTLVPFSNCILNLLSSLNRSYSVSEVPYSIEIGSAIFVTGFVGGLIFILHPFLLTKEYFAWQNICYLSTILMINQFMLDEIITIGEIIGCIAFYIFFIVVVILMEYFRSNLKFCRDKEKPDSNAVQISIINKSTVKVSDMVDVCCMANSHNIITDFMEYIFLACGNVCHRSKLYKRLYTIFISAPIKFLLILVVPVVNNRWPKKGWCKLCRIINVFNMPIVFLVAVKIFQWQFFCGSLILSTIVAIIICFSSSTESPPKYHIIFAIFGILTSGLMLYVAASELVSCLYGLFIFLPTNKQLIGVTLMAWAKSLGVLAANLFLLIGGQYTMACAACYGGPILSVIHSIAIFYQNLLVSLMIKLFLLYTRRGLTSTFAFDKDSCYRQFWSQSTHMMW